MAVLIQFIVLKREGKWVVRSKDLERVFSVQREAVDAAIRFANDSGKVRQARCYYKNRKPNSKRFGHTVRIPIRPPDRIYPSCRGHRSRKNSPAPSVRRSALARPAGDRRELLG